MTLKRAKNKRVRVVKPDRSTAGFSSNVKPVVGRVGFHKPTRLRLVFLPVAVPIFFVGWVLYVLGGKDGKNKKYKLSKMRRFRKD